MKHLKIYEMYNITQKPEIGDYVICEDSEFMRGAFPAELVDCVSESIGKYIGNTRFGNFYIQYDNIPDKFLNFHQKEYTFFEIFDKKVCRIMSEEEIKYWSKNKEDLEYILQTRKYNL